MTHDDNDEIPQTLRDAMATAVPYTPRQTSPQQRGEACQVDNCDTGPNGGPGAPDIWLGIRGTGVYTDSELTQHFNVWVCRHHYQQMFVVVPGEVR